MDNSDIDKKTVLTENSTTPTCFIPFKEDISSIEIPTKLNFPFYYETHPLCTIAALEVQHYLSENKELPHNFGLNDATELLPIGKMFGVLIVEYNGQLGYLAAYSGKLANSNTIDFFVPPVFDMLAQNGYFLQEEEKLNVLNQQIESLEQATIYLDIKQHLIDLNQQKLTQIELLKNQLKENKKERQILRQTNKNILTVAEFAVFEAELIKQSLYDKHLLRKTTAQFDELLAKWQIELNIYQKKIDDLKQRRKKQSNALQQWLFTNYTFLNGNGKEKSLLTIFQNALHAQPPAGAGECCAPKLFQYAFKHQLKPIALAEFWWGSSPKSEIRKHGQFYPSCWGKCEPILNHMLEGLKVDENPFLQNPAEGKELEIVYDDPYLVVVNKPAEFLSVPGINISDSVYQRIKHRYPQATGPLIVHRLDMSTSGLLVLAKNKEVHEHLQKQFLKRKVKKTYVALLDGCVVRTKGKIELPLRGDLNDRPRQMVCYEYGKNALTHFKVIESDTEKTRIEFEPITGRTHQLRVHAAHKDGLLAPIKGDDLYGVKADRLYLHAQNLGFYHPVTKEWVSFMVAPDF